MSDKLETDVSIGPLELEIDSPQYCNYLTIAHSRYEFRLVFGRVMAPPGRGRIETVSPKGVADLIIAPEVIPSMIEAMQSNYSNYLTEMAQWRADNEEESSD